MAGGPKVAAASGAIMTKTKLWGCGAVFAAAVAMCGFAGAARAQEKAQEKPRVPVPLVQAHKTAKISEHVYMIPDGRVNLVPNVGFVVGNRATLVIDVGMGPKNGETVLHELEGVSKNSTVYIVTTHFHPEHVT